MKRILLILILCAISSAAFAQDPVIGVFEDIDATICWGDLEVYVTKTIYVTAILPPGIPAITAAEFRVDHWLGDEGPDCAIVTYNWNTPLVIGDIGWNLALAFSPSLPGPTAVMGEISYFLLDAACVGTDWHMNVQAGHDSGKLVVVDEAYNEIDADGYFYTFNCTAECWCEHCTAATATSWGVVKALY